MDNIAFLPRKGIERRHHPAPRPADPRPAPSPPKRLLATGGKWRFAGNVTPPAAPVNACYETTVTVSRHSEVGGPYGSPVNDDVHRSSARRHRPRNCLSMPGSAPGRAGLVASTIPD